MTSELPEGQAVVVNPDGTTQLGTAEGAGEAGGEELSKLGKFGEIVGEVA